MATKKAQRGFSLVEVMMGVSLITMAALMGSRTLLGATKTIHSMRMQRKASALSDMVFQQYRAYAGSTYQLLAIYNVNRQTPKTFFNKNDNFGYDGFLITTTASYAQNRSTCTVSVRLQWQEGSKTKNSDYLKIYSQVSQAGGGGAVQVWIKYCPAGPWPTDPITQCPGLSGLKVTAPAVTPGDPDVQGTTDATGQALMKRVRLGDAVSFQISASTASQSYYLVDNFGNYAISLTTTVAVSQTDLRTVLITSFRPLGDVTGRIINDPANPIASLNNMQVSLGAPTVILSGSQFRTCQTPCTTLTNIDGVYTFHNVVLGNVNVQATGRAGSDVWIPPTSPSFVQGYTNPTPVTIPSSAWATAFPATPDSLVPALHQDLDLKTFGSVTFIATDQLSGQPLTNANLYLGLPATPFRALTWYAPTIKTDVNGRLSLYNVMAVNNTGISFQMSRAVSAPDHGFFSYPYWTCPGNCVGVENFIPVAVYHEYLLLGQLADDNPAHAVYQNGLAYFSGGFGTGYNGVTVSASGSFAGDAFYANAYGSSNILQPFTVTLFLGNSSWTAATYSLASHNQDEFTGAPAPHAPMIYNAAGNGVYVSDPNGDYTYTGSFGFYKAVQGTVQCENSNFTCSMCALGSSSCPSATPVHIDSRQNSLGINATTGLHGYVHGSYLITGQEDGTVYQMLPNHLKDIRVQGTVTNSASQPVVGITVRDGVNNVIGVTNSAGVYAGWAGVQGDTLSTRRFTITVPTGQTGFNYQNATNGVIYLPTAVDPEAPRTQDFQLQTTGGGGSGNGV